MSFNDFLLDAETMAVVEEARLMVRDEIDPEYLRAMDRDEIKFPVKSTKHSPATIYWE